MIVDHTWCSVNDHTVPDLPHEVMQFGGTLPRILWLLWHADLSAGPIYLSIYDIMDGFYCMFLKANDALRLVITMPSYDNEPPLLAIPLSLTMGWTNSPPTFCAVSETTADLANDYIAAETPLPTDHMEPMASTHDAWANTMIQLGQSAVTMLRDPLVPTSGDPLAPTTGDPLVSTLGAPMPHPGDPLVPTTSRDPLVSTMGDPLVSTLRVPVPHPGDPLVTTMGDPLVSTLGVLAPHPGDPLVPTMGDLLVSTDQSTSAMLGVLVLPPCRLAPNL